MIAERFYYSNSIYDFLNQDRDSILGILTINSCHDINDETKNSWFQEIVILKETLEPFKGRGSVYFEYNIPRMGRRADVIVVVDTIIFVLEFKTGDQKFTRDALMQVWDYAIDLKNFQEGSRDRIIFPVLVAPNENNSNLQTNLNPFVDNVYEPLQSNASSLKEIISNCLASVDDYRKESSPKDDDNWAKSGYEPTPTIIEAAIALYEENTVEDITKHTGDIDNTSDCIERIIGECRKNNQKAICFVTGVPGAGKTLIGLQTAISQFKKEEKAVYLSGNFPLVEVLQEALTRDYINREKERYKSGETEDRPCTKAEAKSKVKAFIQIIHHYRDLYLEGTHIENDIIVPNPGYFQSHTDKSYVPIEHIAIFDEAQRAWTKEELARFMKEKKGIPNFPYSEPEYLISCMNRQIDWGLIICLIGSGQEINKGEAGLNEWIESINRRFLDWKVYLSYNLPNINQLEKSLNPKLLHKEKALHLSINMRSFRAEKLSLFVQQLLDLNTNEASTTLKELQNYPIVLTRSLEKAKQWLREHTRGSERCGILASSKAERLKAISINVRYQPNFVQWFLENETDIRSSNCLEDTLTEFKVQGLEIDWACVAWDADLRLNEDATAWRHYQLRGGTNWQNINKRINQEYQINAYRVLLTRARQGMVIVVPEGDNGVPPDESRKPIWYNTIYNYLKGIGITEIG